MAALTQKTIQTVRQMTQTEFEAEGWHHSQTVRPIVIVLDDGTKLYPAADPEGNGPGALFGVDKDGDRFAVSP